MTQLVGILCGDKIWKQVFSCGLILVTFSVLFLSSFAHVFAQSVPPQIQNGSTINYNPQPTGIGQGIPGVDRPYRPGDSGYRPPTTPGGALTPAEQAAIDAVTGADPASDAAAREATMETPTVVVGEIDDPILKVLHAIVVTGLGWLVGMFGYLFDFSVNYFIIGFGDQFVNYNVGSTVNDLWATVRDIFNLTFIFGLVFIGFKMILDSSDSNARKMLVSLIAAALLVNFSLFITKFIVDFSNIAAFQVYKAFSGSAAGTYSITEGFMNLMGIRSLIGVTYVESGAGGYQYIIGLLVVFLVLAYVFLAGAIMIIVRFALLTIYMIFSPIMFLGWVFPSMKGKSSEYWNGFLGQAFFAPAFIFMLYLSYKVADSYKFGQKSFEHLFNTSGGRGVLTPTIGGIDPTVPYFAMVIVFLVASIVVAKSIGNTSAKFGMAISGKVVGGATAGLAGGIARNTVGRYGQRVASNDALKELASQKGLRGWTARQQLRAGRVIADSSFDARNIAGAGKTLGIGAGAKGGYKTKIEATAKRDTDFAEKLGTVSDSDIRVAVRIKERDEADMALRIAKKGDDPKQIKLAEDNLNKANETLEKERRRRQIGGTFTTEANKVAIAKEDEKINALKTQLSKGWKEYLEAKNLKVKESLLNGLKDLEKAKKAAEAQRKIYTKTNVDGYANVVDIGSNWDKVQSYVMGRTLHESRESAEAIRKKFTKETKKTKDELNTDSIVKAVTSSAKSH